ncbi:MAG: tyrosine-type recombinase/integrase [Prolixibacteraceae bacterium]
MEKQVLIRLPVIYDAGGDISKKWFIQYYVRNPRNGRLERQRSYRGINKFHTLKERREAAEKMRRHWSDKLKAGWSPFVDESVIYDDNLEYQTAIKNYRKMKSKNGTFRFFASKYIDWKKPALEDKSVSTYRSRLRIFDSWLEGKGISDADISCITHKIMVEFSDHIINVAELSRSTVLNYQNLLKEVFDFIRKERKQFPNPCFELPGTRRVNDSAAYPIQEMDIPIFKKAIEKKDPQLWLACSFVYYCFIRPRKELRFLRIGDIDFGRSTVLIREENSKTGKRKVTIPRVFMKELREKYQLHNYPRDFYVIGKNREPGPKPVSYNNMSNRWVAFRENLNMPEEYKMYSWKHTGNIRASRNSIPLRDLQGQNGHTTIATTEEYMKNQEGYVSHLIVESFPEL